MKRKIKIVAAIAIALIALYVLPIEEIFTMIDKLFCYAIVIAVCVVVPIQCLLSK